MKPTGADLGKFPRGVFRPGGLPIIVPAPADNPTILHQGEGVSPAHAKRIMERAGIVGWTGNGGGGYGGLNQEETGQDSQAEQDRTESQTTSKQMNLPSQTGMPG
jgi:hypothetical protein